jgi:nucleoside-diphosphate-sugar epimerase
VSGASGFVARALLAAKPSSGSYVAASRLDPGIAGVEWRLSPGLSGEADWKVVLEGIDVVVHLAGRVHLPAGGDASPYFMENSDGTAKLARDAASAGVRRFVFLSSAKVLGDESGPAPLLESAPTCPGDPYTASKLEAERALAALGGGMQVTVIRPPLVYGPGVRANFLALFTAVARGVPLPLEGINNRRSLVYVENLASAIGACIESPAAAGRTYNVTDGAAVSTPQLVRAIASALGRQPRLFSIPPRLLEACGGLLGRAETVKRLTRSLELDDKAIRAELRWQPPSTFETGIGRTARWYEGRTTHPI